MSRVLAGSCGRSEREEKRRREEDQSKNMRVLRRKTESESEEVTMGNERPTHTPKLAQQRSSQVSLHRFRQK
jgi:hypothetical protein